MLTLVNKKHSITHHVCIFNTLPTNGYTLSQYSKYNYTHKAAHWKISKSIQA